MKILYLNCYFPNEYQAHLRNGQVPPPNIYSLPFELLAEIILQAAGTNNIAKALTLLELVSKEWRRAVNFIWEIHGTRVLERSGFSADKIAEATTTLTAFGPEPTVKNIYKLLSTKTYSVILFPTQPLTYININPKSLYFFWYAKNSGKYPIRVKFARVVIEDIIIPPGRICRSRLYSHEEWPFDWSFVLSCLQGNGCEGTAEIIEFPFVKNVNYFGPGTNPSCN